MLRSIIRTKLNQLSKTPYKYNFPGVIILQYRTVCTLNLKKFHKFIKQNVEEK